MTKTPVVEVDAEIAQKLSETPVEVSLDPTGPKVPSTTIESSKPGATASDSVLVGEGLLVVKPGRRRERPQDPFSPPFCCTVSGCCFNALAVVGKGAPGEHY